MKWIEKSAVKTEGVHNLLHLSPGFSWVCLFETLVQVNRIFYVKFFNQVNTCFVYIQLFFGLFVNILINVILSSKLFHLFCGDRVAKLLTLLLFSSQETVEIINTFLSYITNFLAVADSVGSSNCLSSCSTSQIIQLVFNEVFKRKVKRTLILYDNVPWLFYQKIHVFLLWRVLLLLHFLNSEVYEHLFICFWGFIFCCMSLNSSFIALGIILLIILDAKLRKFWFWTLGKTLSRAYQLVYTRNTRIYLSLAFFPRGEKMRVLYNLI